MPEVKINVFEQISSTAAVSSEDGEMLFKKIDKALENKASVILDFNNIDLITSTFLNASIGQLYGKYKSDYIKEYLKVEKLSNDDLFLMKIVVDRAKEYFKDKNGMDDEIKKIFED